MISKFNAGYIAGFLLLIVVFCTSAARADVVPTTDNDTLRVCANLDTYVALAAKGRDVNMPLQTATSTVDGSIRQNMKLSPDMLDAFIDVVNHLYTAVYADKSISLGHAQDAIIDACSKFNGRAVDKNLVARYLDQYPQSGWNPLERVPLCVKMGQTAANIAAARDKGMQKEKIDIVARAGLANDKLTLAEEPRMLAEVYGNMEIKAGHFFGYNSARCNAEAKGVNTPDLSILKSRILECQALTSQADEQACGRKLFGM